MSFGSDTPGGSPEGIGGNESGIGSSESGSGGGSESPSYSKEAMESALAAADQQMYDNNMEAGLAVSPGGRTALEIGTAMDAYTGGYPEAASVVADVNRKNDFKDLGYFDQSAAKKAAEAVGMNTDYMSTANRERFGEKAANFMGGTLGTMLGGMTGVPVAALAGGHYGNQMGTQMAERNDRQKISESLGLVPSVTGGVTDTGHGGGALSKSATDTLIKRLMARGEA